MRDEHGRFLRAVTTQAAGRRRANAPADSEKEELLTVESHPILGRIERWRMSDGTVQRFEEHPAE